MILRNRGPRGLSHLNFVSLLILLVMSFCAAACSQDDAEIHCRREGGFSGESLNACIFGATQVGPNYQVITAADEECNCRYPVREDLNADGHCNRFRADATHPKYSPIVFRGNPAWADETNARINLYNACHAGSASHLVSSGLQTISTVTSTGCIQQVDAGTGALSCRTSTAQ